MNGIPGFAVVADFAAGDLSLLISPDAPTNPLISYSARGGRTAAVMGRIFQAADWWNRLGLPPSARTSDLLLAATEQFGGEIIRDFAGEFCAVVADISRRQLIGCRDVTGGYSLFWSSQGQTHALGTNPLMLAQMSEARPALDPAFFAEYLVSSAGRGEAACRETPYRGVSRVLPGEFVQLRNQSPQILSAPDWGSRLIDPGVDDLPTAAAAYRQALTEAVRQRLFGHTISQLSGGMDSTAVSLVAAEITHVNQSTKLDAVSLVYHHHPKLAAERKYLEEVLLANSQLTPHWIEADELLSFDAFADPPAHDEPFAGLWHMETDLALIQRAHACSAETMLTGLGADEVLDAAPFFLADYLRRGKWLQAYRQAAKYASGRGYSPWTALQIYGWEPLCLRWGWIKATNNPRSSFPASDATVPRWISTSFAREHRLRERLAHAARAPFVGHRTSQLSVPLQAIADRCGAGARQFALRYGVHLSHPFLDPQVIGIGLGIRARIPTSDETRQKPLLAEALRDRLPPAIIRRRLKGHFDETYYAGLRKNVAPLNNLIEQTDSSELPLFDIPLLKRCLREAQFGAATAAHLKRFDSTLSLLCWLSQRQWNKKSTEWRQIHHFREGGVAR